MERRRRTAEQTLDVPVFQILEGNVAVVRVSSPVRLNLKVRVPVFLSLKDVFRQPILTDSVNSQSFQKRSLNFSDRQMLPVSDRPALRRGRLVLMRRTDVSVLIFTGNCPF